MVSPANRRRWDEELATKYALLRRLAREYGRAYLPSYLVAFFFMAVVAACSSLTAWVMRDVINRIFVDQSRQALIHVPMAIVAIFAAKGLASYFQEATLDRIGNGEKQHIFAMTMPDPFP